MEQTLFTYAPARPRKRPKSYGKFAALTGLTPGTNEYKKAWARANRERNRAIKQKWAEANRDKIVAKGQRYRRENPEKRRATCRSWQERHPEHHRRLRNKSMRKAYKEDPTKFILRENARRFRNGTVTREEWRAIFDAHGGHCAYCGAPATAIDHIHPLSRGGKHTKDNVAPACKPCNSSKHNKLLSEWKGPPCRR